jgi:alanyl-tRNA synthetase
LKTILKNKKNKLTLDDWVLCMQSHGIPVDKIAEISGTPIPLNLYNEIHLRQERTAKAPENVLYSTTHLPETDMIFYDDHHLMEFDANIVEVFKNAQEQDRRSNIVILDRSAIYPTSGGQEHDTGIMKIAGCAGEYKIVNAVKVGKVVLHTLDRPLPGYVEMFKGKKVSVKIDSARRQQLQAHHTGTHLVFAACRRVLGPHVWQNGAKKTA